MVVVVVVVKGEGKWECAKGGRRGNRSHGMRGRSGLPRRSLDGGGVAKRRTNMRRTAALLPAHGAVAAGGQLERKPQLPPCQ